MTYQRERDEFLNIIQSEGMDYTTATRMLRYASTLNRLATAMCNGDWPADNGERKTVVCTQCGCGWARSSFRKGVCPDCRTEQLVKDALPQGYKAVFSGDPRGCVFKIQVPSGRTNDWGKEGICVPVR